MIEHVEVQAADREIARQTALRARAVAAFAATRPASADRPQGAPGAMSAGRWAARPEVLRPVSEWATQELAVALSLSAEAAQALLERSLVLVHRLPLTLAALEAGTLHPGHLWPLLDEVAPITDDALRAAMERDLLAWAAGQLTTSAQLGEKARREVLKRGARAAPDRHGRARDRRCRFPGCRRRTGHLDHDTPWPTGPTAAPDLAGYCAGHHRGKHQAPGRRHDLAADGTLTVTTPTGLTATTTPPPY
ncbi:hypothetical protein [Geodermatophilus sp. SYSU D00684]